MLVTELPRCAEKASALLAALQELEEQEVVDPVPPFGGGQGILYPCFCGQETIGKLCLTLNLRPLSPLHTRGSVWTPFSQSGLLPPNCFMASVDLGVPTCLHIPIAEGFVEVSQVRSAYARGDDDSAVSNIAL